MPVLLAIVVVIAAAGIAKPTFFSATGVIDILLGVSIVAILAVGQTLVIVMRHIDLSVGSLIGFTSFVIGDLYDKGFGTTVAIAAALGIGLIVGAINGVLVAYLKLPSLVVTLGSLYIVRGVFSDYAFGRTITAAMVPPEVSWLGLNRTASGSQFVEPPSHHLRIHSTACLNPRHQPLPSCVSPTVPQVDSHITCALRGNGLGVSSEDGCFEFFNPLRNLALVAGKIVSRDLRLKPKRGEILRVGHVPRYQFKLKPLSEDLNLSQFLLRCHAHRPQRFRTHEQPLVLLPDPRSLMHGRTTDRFRSHPAVLEPPVRGRTCRSRGCSRFRFGRLT
ncbi:ABC transporter permease [bacterium]|nr:ABC transporter permease [bacterium]